MDAPLRRLVVYAHNHCETILVEAVSEVGSGLNGGRPKLLKLLAIPETIVVEHRDRLMGTGAE